MRIIVAETAGFCWGVQRALDISLDVAKSTGGRVYTHGPLIHNTQVVDELKKRKITPVEGNIESARSGTLVVRAHGIRPDLMTEIKEKHGNVVDATCPLVSKVHRQVIKYQNQGYKIYIMGDPKHPEVIGIIGSANDEAVVIPPNPEEAARLPDHLGRVCLVSQTTQNDEVFARVAAALKSKCEELRVANTICEPTRSHQMEIVDMAARVDTVVVVGGRHSANTRHLAELAAELGPRVVHVETDAELHAEDFKNTKIVGVTAGASTPQWMIQRVVDRLESFNGNRSRLKRVAKEIMGWLVTTHLHTTTAFASLFLGIISLLNLRFDAGVFLSTIAVVFGLHCVNEFGDEPGFDRRSRLSPVAYHRFRMLMLFLAVASLIAGIGYSIYEANERRISMAVPTVLVISSLFGLVYSWKVIPKKFINITGFSSIKDLPGSKDLSVSLGWTVLLGLIPLFTSQVIPGPAFFAVMIPVSMHVYRRSAIMGVRDAQGDRIVGMESSFKFIGRSASKKLHLALDIFCLVGILPVAIAGRQTPVTVAMAALAAILGLLFSVLYHIRRLPAGNPGQFILDLQFVLPGSIGVALAFALF